MRKNMTIRAKITIANIILLIIASSVLSVTSKLSAAELLNLIPLDSSIGGIPSIIPENDSSLENSDMVEKIPAQLVQEATKTYASSINFYVILVIICGGVATYLTMKRLLRSLEDLENQIEQISVDNLSKKIEIANCDAEIMSITKKFNNMTDKLNHSFEVQKRFSQSAAHELRTPLTVIRTKLDVFRKSNRTQAEYEMLIDSMKEHTERLTNVVESLLSLTNSDEMAFNTEVSLDKIFKKVLSDLYEYIDEKNIHIMFQETNTTIQGNEPLLYRCMYNLIENAIMYNKENGYIQIILNQTATQTLIIIKDSGVGIPSELKSDIFEPFFRVDKSRSRKLGGSGLGLSIVKEIVMKHQGTIEVFNNEPNGTVFKIKINNLTKI